MNGETGVTASGYNLDNGIRYQGYNVLAGDKTIPLGTLIDIKLEDGKIIHGVVLDRGGAISGSHFDIVMDSRNTALAFGRQEIEWQKVGSISI
jgi:3D (Asp-Asp-Asp) domain-containing protein